MAYNWQHKNWPDFIFDKEKTPRAYIQYGINAGELYGFTEGLDDDSKTELLLNMLVNEAMKTSEIEGEFFNRQEVYSSVQKNLGLKPDVNVSNAKAHGAAELVVYLHHNFIKPLSQKELFHWHQILMTGYNNIRIGSWRTKNEPMRVISGRIGKEIIHFEAPESSRVPEEMKRFINWFNATAPENEMAIDNPIIRAAIAHVYFESIHPFEDGNGRIGRAISEKALAQHIGRPVLFSLSKSIENEKQAYYDALKQAQSSLDLTQWITYFTNLVIDAQKEAKETVLFVVKKSKFYKQFGENLNARQKKVVNRMFDAGPSGFEGGMTAKKYISIAKTSKATATRDLQQLVELGALNLLGGGRSVSYNINI
jgi:Fic family protein